MNLVQVDKVFDDHITECDQKAEASLKRRKYMMYGYWMAIAIHLRKLKRKIRTDLVTKEAGFPTRHERSIIEEQQSEIRQLTSDLATSRKQVIALRNERGALAFDLDRAKRSLASAEEQVAVLASKREVA